MIDFDLLSEVSSLPFAAFLVAKKGRLKTRSDELEAAGIDSICLAKQATLRKLMQYNKLGVVHAIPFLDPFFDF